MKLAVPISICCDLSEVAVEEAWKQAGSPDNWSLIVGTSDVGYARTIRINGKKPYVWVNPEWDRQWMLSSRYSNIFSEGV